jgi:hypothetical protein
VRYIAAAPAGEGDNPFRRLIGLEEPFTKEHLRALYTTRENYLANFNYQIHAMVAAGTLLPRYADKLIKRSAICSEPVTRSASTRGASSDFRAPRRGVTLQSITARRQCDMKGDMKASRRELIGLALAAPIRRRTPLNDASYAPSTPASIQGAASACC